MESKKQQRVPKPAEAIHTAPPFIPERLRKALLSNDEPAPELVDEFSRYRSAMLERMAQVCQNPQGFRCGRGRRHQYTAIWCREIKMSPPYTHRAFIKFLDEQLAVLHGQVELVFWDI